MPINYMKHFTRALSVTTVLASLALLSTPVTALAQTDSELPRSSCSHTTGINVDIPVSDFLVLAPEGQAWGITERGPYAAVVPAGVYNINFTSYDDHSLKGGGGQTEEQWYFEAYANGNKVFTSNISADLPEDQDYISGLLNTEATLPAIDSILIRHKLEVDTDGHLPQSIIPVCVNFTSVVKGGQGNGQVLGANTDNPSTKNNGGVVLGGTTSVSALANTGVNMPTTLLVYIFAISSSLACLVGLSKRSSR